MVCFKLFFLKKHGDIVPLGFHIVYRQGGPAIVIYVSTLRLYSSSR